MFEHRLSDPNGEPGSDNAMYDNVQACLDLALGQAHMIGCAELEGCEHSHGRLRLAALALENQIMDAKAILKAWADVRWEAQS